MLFISCMCWLCLPSFLLLSLCVVASPYIFSNLPIIRLIFFSSNIPWFLPSILSKTVLKSTNFTSNLPSSFFLFHCTWFNTKIFFRIPCPCPKTSLLSNREFHSFYFLLSSNFFLNTFAHILYAVYKIFYPLPFCDIRNNYRGIEY